MDRLLCFYIYILFDKRSKHPSNILGKDFFVLIHFKHDLLRSSRNCLHGNLNYAQLAVPKTNGIMRLFFPSTM